MKYPDVSLLSEDELETSEVIQKYGDKCSATDFAILLGIAMNDDIYVGEEMLENRTVYWWIKAEKIVCIDEYGASDYSCNGYDLVTGARPVIRFSEISDKLISKKYSDGILEVEYGMYPQTAVNYHLNKKLEELYKANVINKIFSTEPLIKTGNTYTINSERDDDEKDFTPECLDEYQYLNSRYVRVVVRNAFKDLLSNGVYTKENKPFWVRVEPITWLVDKKTDKAIAKKVLFSGVALVDFDEEYEDFDKTCMKNILNKYFIQDINQSVTNSKEVLIGNNSRSTKLRKINPYNFSFDEVTEENIIRGMVESNIAVFLHGRSSDGKSARVKQMDPNCEIIYLRNATPESLNGKSVYNQTTGEMIDIKPTWLTKLEDKCEKEPDKIHILFFDEITNALPSIQGMAFNIVLDGEVNGKWKLPKNARIVAAGNDLNDSLAANQMAEPLFNRFAHVYINTTPSSWLAWASTPTNNYEMIDYKEEELPLKIHPSIYAYISCKSFGGRDVLRTAYDGKKPNADPRKWEMASKVLYKTGKPEMLRALIGEPLTKEFVEFTRQQVKTLDDVLKGNYDDEELEEMDTSQKFLMIAVLSAVDEEHFEIARNFMSKLGEEPRAVFDSLWTHGDEKRLEKLAEVKMTEEPKIMSKELPKKEKEKSTRDCYVIYGNHDSIYNDTFHVKKLKI